MPASDGKPSRRFPLDSLPPYGGLGSDHENPHSVDFPRLNGLGRPDEPAEWISRPGVIVARGRYLERDAVAGGAGRSIRRGERNGDRLLEKGYDASYSRVLASGEVEMGHGAY